jgi:hypothetical protein
MKRIGLIWWIKDALPSLTVSKFCATCPNYSKNHIKILIEPSYSIPQIPKNSKFCNISLKNIVISVIRYLFFAIDQKSLKDMPNYSINLSFTAESANNKDCIFTVLLRQLKSLMYFSWVELETRQLISPVPMWEFR